MYGCRLCALCVALSLGTIFALLTPDRARSAPHNPTRTQGDKPMSGLEITVGPAGANVLGSDHFALQSAVDYVAGRGGGTVRILPGTYEMGNSLFLREGVRLVGSGDKSVLRKCDCATTPLTAHSDWYEEIVTVKDPTPFRVGGGIWIEGMSPFYKDRNQIARRTVVGIAGNVIRLDKALRDDYWLEPGANASTAFPVITAEYVNDATVESLAIDGNREHNPHLDDNHTGAIFIQDCDRMIFRDLTIRDYNSDGISAQICDGAAVSATVPTWASTRAAAASGRRWSTTPCAAVRRGSSSAGECATAWPRATPSRTACATASPSATVTPTTSCGATRFAAAVRSGCYSGRTAEWAVRRIAACWRTTSSRTAG